jgi:hypothetical protein
MLSIGLGGVIPILLAGFPEDSAEREFAYALFPSLAIITFSVFGLIGRKIPTLQERLGDSGVAGCLILFLFMFVAVGISVLIALIPIPFWLQVVLGLAIAFVALAVLGQEISNRKYN